MSSRLTNLYKAMETLRKEGFTISEDIERQIIELEEEIIKKEIFPIVTENIEPVLKQVQRDLVLVVDYHPGNPISLSLSRKANVAELIDAKLLEIDPLVDHKVVGKQKNPAQHISAKKILRVTFPDGYVIEGKKASNTFVEAITRIGYMRVRALGLARNGVLIVSNTLDSKYAKAQLPIGDGFYVMTHCSTHDKKKVLDTISKELNLNLLVEEI